MQHNKTIFETLFNSNFADADNIEFLQVITAAHPYFSPAQFYRLQQTDPGSDLYKKQAVRTNILFNNPYWLHFQLLQTAQPAAVPEITAAPIILKNQLLTGSSDDMINNTAFAEDMDSGTEHMKIAFKMPEQKINTEEAMLFEPMHMVDYFASQGIKLSDAVQTGDKLGKQLKSFTEWLKTMKKVHAETETETNVQTDQNITKLAENSNADAEVLTESMAEVFAKQGKKSKATEVYLKLSLLNPAKSTYFAVKIENLKEI